MRHNSSLLQLVNLALVSEVFLIHCEKWRVDIFQACRVFGTWLGMIRITWGKSPEWLYRNPRFSKRATVGVRAPMWPGKTPVWSESSVDERNLYFARSAIIGLAVETWRVKTELIIITILHIIIITTSILNLDFQNICAKNIGAYNMHK